MTTVTLTAKVQTFTAPTTSVCDILAFGAQGGPDTASSAGPVPGGLGAEIGGDVTLTAGQKLTVFVGGKGGNGSAGSGGGFVVRAGHTPSRLAARAAR